MVKDPFLFTLCLLFVAICVGDTINAAYRGQFSKSRLNLILAIIFVVLAFVLFRPW